MLNLMISRKDSTTKNNTKLTISELWSKFGVLFLLLLLVVILSFASEFFFTTSNLFNILRQVSLIGLIAIGEFFLITSAAFDMSAGSIVALSGVATAFMLKYWGLPIWLAILLGIMTGALAGLVNGYCVAKRRIPAFIATLGMMSIARGLAYLITNGFPISGLPSGFALLGRGYVGPIPIPALILVLFFFLAWVVSNRTTFGRYMLAIGGNVEATALSGIKIAKYRIMGFVLSGALAGFSGIILASRLSSGDPGTGLQFEFDAITAVVLGGTSIYGGEGTIRGVIIGTLFMGVLTNGMNLLNVSSYFQLVVKGLVLILAVGIDTAVKRD